MNYQSKYLKYKNKYLQMKNIHKLINNTQTGGAKEITIEGQIYEQIEKLPQKVPTELYIIEPNTNSEPIRVTKVSSDINASKNIELIEFEDINEKKYLIVCKFKNELTHDYDGTILSGRILFQRKIPDTPCQNFLKELKILLTNYPTNNLYVNPVLINTGETMEKGQEGERIGYPNNVVKEIIDIYNKHFSNNYQPISDEMCRNFLTDLLDDKKEIFLCKFTQELLVNPVTTKFGITYSKTSLDEWISRSTIDPISQKPIEKPYYYSNTLVENIIKALQQNNLL